MRHMSRVTTQLAWSDHWFPEELEIIARMSSTGPKDFARVAKRLGRWPASVRFMRIKLKTLQRARERSGAFLPDDGTPYFAKAALLLKSG
jgi:hypothetical protein